jgi:hypothetical protein
LRDARERRASLPGAEHHDRERTFSVLKHRVAGGSPAAAATSRFRCRGLGARTSLRGCVRAGSVAAEGALIALAGQRGASERRLAAGHAARTQRRRA